MLCTFTLMRGTLSVFLVVQAAAAAAQGTFGKMPGKIHPGQEVIVDDEQGGVTKGLVEEVSALTLTVNFGRGTITDPPTNTTRTFTPDQVQRVRKPGPIWDGAIKGALIGLIPAAAIATADDCHDCNSGQILGGMALAGAGIGLGIDALIGPKTVYRRDTKQAHVSVAPIFGGGRRGVAAALRF